MPDGRKKEAGGRLDQSSCSQTPHGRHGPPTLFVTCAHVPVSVARFAGLIRLAQVHGRQWMVVDPLREPDAIDQTNWRDAGAEDSVTGTPSYAGVALAAAVVGAG
jgi:hypothetical protein